MSDTETLPVDHGSMDPEEKDIEYLIKKIEEQSKTIEAILEILMPVKGDPDRG